MQKARQKVGGAPTPVWVPTLPVRFLQPTSFLNPVLLGFYGGFIT